MHNFAQVLAHNGQDLVIKVIVPEFRCFVVVSAEKMECIGEIISWDIHMAEQFQRLKQSDQIVKDERPLRLFFNLRDILAVFVKDNLEIFVNEEQVIVVVLL